MTLAGHGCPRWRKWIADAVIICLCACVGAISQARAQTPNTATPNTAQPFEVDIEVRAVWGGGPVRSFAGSIALAEGSLEVVRNLSIQDDAVAAVLSNGRSEVAIRSNSPANFGGVDLHIKGKLDTQLKFEFREPGSSQPPQTVQVSLKQLLSGRAQFAIDARGSKLAIERPLHDRVRVKLNGGQSILQLGDAANLSVDGYRTGLAAGDYRVNVRLLESGSDRSLVQQNQDITVDDKGSFATANFTGITLPESPGVYSLDVTLVRRRLINSLMSGSSIPNRRIEFVVAPSRDPLPQSKQTSLTEWQPVSQIYPAGVSWWDSLGKFRIPTALSMAPLVAQVARPFSSGDHQRQMLGNRECMVLATGAWQAFPMAIDQIGRPHRVSIQVPADGSQKLVFSVHEPSQASDAPSLRLDTGMLVEAGITTVDGITTHQMLFWPKQAHSYFLVMNADSHHQAILAEVNLEMATNGLSPTTSIGTVVDETTRISSLYLDKPLLAENFCAMRRVEGSRELDSWETVWQSSERLAQYTAWSGHNAATVTVATQGGAIYPSQVWNSTHKFDSGTFLTDGSSPEIKDWVELICCQFDQRGLKLILALDVEGPLGELERAETEKATADPAVLIPRYQVDLEGHVAKANYDEPSPEARKHTLYNPLDSRVQTVLMRMVSEVAQRYGKHACFAGVQINLSERSHFNFAGDAWGYDEESLARFERNMGSALPKDASERAKLLRGPLRLAFLNDRAEQLRSFYTKLAKDIAARSPGSRLVINPTKLVAMPPATENFLLAASQSLTASDLLLANGVDCRALSAVEQVMMLRPEADSPLRVPASRAWSYRLAADNQLDAMFAGQSAGAIIQQLPTSFRLPDYDKVNPYGNGKARTWLFPQAVTSGDAARRSLSNRLYYADVQHLTSGGWLVPIGQEDMVRPLVLAYRQFPAVVMRDLAPSGVSSTLRVRRIEQAGKTYLQFVNAASWSESVDIRFKSSTDAAVAAFGCLAGQDGQLSDVGDTDVAGDITHKKNIRAGQPEGMQFTVAAYGVVGVCIEAERVELLNIASSPPKELSSRMETRLSNLQKLIDRAGELNEQQTLGLRGGDFETWESNSMPLGWTVSTHPSTSVTKDHELPRSGAACVRLENRSESNATVWIQSDRIAIPATGRLALEVWVRTLPGRTQPTVRLSLVGRYRDGKRFQRWHEFASMSEPDPEQKPGASSASKQSRLPIDWGNRPLVLLVPDVPNEELSELRAAVDVVGQGTLWVDDVRVYGMYLHPDEKVHLSGQMFMARQQMRQGDYALADQMLGSFWSNFLSTYLPVDQPNAPAEGSRANEARLPTRGATGPAWRKPNSPRVNQWQESLKNRWQR